MWINNLLYASYQVNAESNLDYICNLEKTDGKLLESSYGCTVETTDIEVEWIADI